MITVLDPRSLPPALIEFITERHLATLTTLRADGSPHVVPVGFTYDTDRAVIMIITSAGSVKARNAARGQRAAVCQVDGGRWVTFEGVASCSAEAQHVAAAVAAYAGRYRTPRERDDRVVIEIAVDRLLASSGW